MTRPRKRQAQVNRVFIFCFSLSGSRARAARKGLGGSKQWGETPDVVGPKNARPNAQGYVPHPGETAQYCTDLDSCFGSLPTSAASRPFQGPYNPWRFQLRVTSQIGSLVATEVEDLSRPATEPLGSHLQR